MPNVPLTLPDTPAPPGGTLTIFRYADYDTPFWDRPNTRDGRWHRVGDEPTQYWSLSPEASWAELIRYEELYAEDDLDLVRMPMWVSRVKLGVALDLRDTAEQGRHGITEAELIGDDHTPCQDLGVELRSDEMTMILTPSAALDGHTNLTIFGKRRMSDWCYPQPMTRALPATVAAIGRPPEKLIPRVRRRAVGPWTATLF